MIKKVRLLTPVIDNQNKLLEDWKRSLERMPHRPNLPLFAEVVDGWKQETVKAIQDFVSRRVANITDPLDRQYAESELTLQVIQALRLEMTHLIACRCLSNIKKILAAGATVGITAGLVCLAYRLLQDGENGQSAIKRAQAQQEKTK